MRGGGGGGGGGGLSCISGNTLCHRNNCPDQPVCFTVDNNETR